MPNLEPVVVERGGYILRHVGPRASVWPSSPAANIAVLGQATMVARRLPSSSLPSSPDFVSGSLTSRIGDSGEASLTFPNKEASDGAPWRQRFDPTGHLQWVEAYYNGELEFTGVIDKVPTVDSGQVQVHAADGFWVLNKAYERDWIVTQAPRDVIERGTQTWVPITVDNFPSGSSLSVTSSTTGTITTPTTAAWAYTINSGATIALASNQEGVKLATALPGAAVTMTAPTVSNTVASQIWRLVVGLGSVVLGGTTAFVVTIGNTKLTLFHPTGTSNIGAVLSNGSASTQTVLTSSFTSVSLMIECDGTWISGFLNGQLIGCFRTDGVAVTGSADTNVKLVGPSGSAVLQYVFLETEQPFLQRGADKGDYVLPGGPSTYPSGGLHARYFNDNDLANDTSALVKVLNPTRSQAYGSSSQYEYMNQQDPQINGQNPPGFTQTNPGPGTGALAGWSCKWFGAVWLPLSSVGNIGMQLNVPAGAAARVWIGKTQFGSQIADGWTYSDASTDYLLFNVSAASLAGTPSYDGTPVAKDGWYPIVIEYSVPAATTATAPALYFVFGSSYGGYTPTTATWTDPGGSTIQPSGTGTNAYMAVPSTSLSPLGCVDQRYQGTSHYTLVQQTAQAFGYQVAMQPKQLESGLFPGTLAPRAPSLTTGIGQGQATDIILTPDDGPRQAGEGLVNYSSGLDATDFCASLWGNGAGFQNGTTGQLQGQVFDPATVLGSLFDVQGWQDFSDASFTSLLVALLNSQLGLQLSPWQLLSADPKGAPRKAYAWPLPSSLVNMRWRAGDALFIRAPDINVFDTTPRQMLTFTRSISPSGIMSSQAQFAERPKTQARAIRQALYKTTRLARSNQRQRTTLTGSYVPVSTIGAGATDSNYSVVSLLPSDQVVSAFLRVTYNPANLPFGVSVNGADATGVLSGPWKAAPVAISLMPVLAVQTAAAQFFCQVENQGSSSGTFSYQLLVDVLR